MRSCRVRPSMGSIGDAYDNAMAESFFASLECELLDRRVFRTQVEARMEVFRYIEGWYNPRRRHSALGYLSPVRFEAEYGARVRPTLAPPTQSPHPSPRKMLRPTPLLRSRAFWLPG